MDMQKLRTVVVVGGEAQNDNRFVTFYNQNHNINVHKASPKANPETIFNTMAKRSRKQFSKTRMTGLHETPPFHMKGIEESKHMPPPGKVQARMHVHSNTHDTVASPVKPVHVKPNAGPLRLEDNDFNELWD